LEYEEARTAYERAVRSDPANSEARLGVMRSLYLAGQLSAAAVRLDAHLAEKPQDADALLLYAKVASAEGNRDSARVHYQKAVGLKPLLKDTGLEKDLFPSGPPAPPAEPRVALRMTPQGPVTDQEFGQEADPTGPSRPAVEVEKPSMTFADVGGMEKVKEEIRMKILYPLQNPQLFKAYGKKIGGGVLLYGPPGCGKTLLSRATAGEIKATFISVGLHEILDMYIGNSEKQLHALFEAARKSAPSVLFFDEVDALAADRKDFRQSAGRTLINQFLDEMDGAGAKNEGVLILGATNAPWHIDSAFRRPGRFDRILFVPPPDEQAREAVIHIMAKDKPVTDLNHRDIARACKDFSGADLKAMFDLAIERALAEAMKSGRIVPIGTKDLVRAAKDCKPTARAWFESARNYALYANQGGFYDDILDYLGLKK
jgi:SpoVK/Ycf46/Vps4 family AAA+-type ATPase